MGEGAENAVLWASWDGEGAAPEGGAARVRRLRSGHAEAELWWPMVPGWGDARDSADRAAIFRAWAEHERARADGLEEQLRRSDFWKTAADLRASLKQATQRESDAHALADSLRAKLAAAQEGEERWRRAAEVWASQYNAVARRLEAQAAAAPAAPGREADASRLASLLTFFMPDGYPADGAVGDQVQVAPGATSPGSWWGSEDGARQREQNARRHAEVARLLLSLSAQPPACPEAPDRRGGGLRPQEEAWCSHDGPPDTTPEGAQRVVLEFADADRRPETATGASAWVYRRRWSSPTPRFECVDRDARLRAEVLEAWGVATWQALAQERENVAALRARLAPVHSPQEDARRMDRAARLARLVEERAAHNADPEARHAAPVPARLDPDGTAEPKTKIVSHPRHGECVGPGQPLVDPEHVDRETGRRTPLAEQPRGAPGPLHLSRGHQGWCGALRGQWTSEWDVFQRAGLAKCGACEEAYRREKYERQPPAAGEEPDPAEQEPDVEVVWCSWDPREVAPRAEAGPPEGALRVVLREGEFAAHTFVDGVWFTPSVHRREDAFRRWGASERERAVRRGKALDEAAEALAHRFDVEQVRARAEAGREGDPILKAELREATRVWARAARMARGLE